MKKIFTLLFLVLGFVGQASADNILKGEWDGWQSHIMSNVSGTIYSYTIQLNGNNTYKFGVSEGETYYKNEGTIKWYECRGWVFDFPTNDCKITTQDTGNYTFTWDTSNHSLTVTYPLNTYTVYFYNHPTEGDWTAFTTPYVYILGDAKWDSKGSGSKGRPLGVAMTKVDGSSNIWKADINCPEGSDWYIAFVDGMQDNYDNFANTRVVYRSDFNTNVTLYVPSTTKTDDYNPYEEGGISYKTTYFNEDGQWYNASYTRNELSSGKFGTICLPFDATVEGATVFQITSKIMDGGDLKGINLESVSTLTAGHAYIFKATGSTLTATIAGNNYNESALPDDDDGTNGGMVGYLDPTPDNVPTNAFIIKDNQLRKVVDGGNATVSQFRAYITLTGIGEASARSAYFIEFDDESTGIENIQADNSQYTVYNLQGQRVTDNQKGLLIVNGKKMLRK